MSSHGPIAEIVLPYLDKAKLSSRNIHALCPFHSDTKPSFSINIENGMWVCGGCKEKGGLSTFLHLIGLPKTEIDSRMRPVKNTIERYKKQETQKRSLRFRGDSFRGEYLLPEALLGVYNFAPNDLLDKGFNAETLKKLNIGYDNKKDRIIFPIRDLYGNLVGVSGRSTIGEYPRYKVYQGGYTNNEGQKCSGDFGPEFDEEFPKYKCIASKYVWNAHKVYPSVFHSDNDEELIFIVEGYKVALWLIQHGYTNVIATMGSYMSRQQYDIIARMYGRFVILYDNDPSGIQGAKKISKWLSRLMPNRIEICTLDSWAHQADDLNEYGLKEAIKNRKRFVYGL
jgi:DNA primase